MLSHSFFHLFAHALLHVFVARHHALGSIYLSMGCAPRTSGNLEKQLLNLKAQVRGAIVRIAVVDPSKGSLDEKLVSSRHVWPM